MKRITVFDIWSNDTNMGNQIIMEAVNRELRDVFPDDFFYSVPALERIQIGRKLVQNADFAFVAGGNLLRSDMNNKNSDWPLRWRDAFWLKGLVLMGVGWWQYQSHGPNLFSRFLMRRIMHPTLLHSVRDNYTLQRIKALGLNGLNTGCPTLWRLNRTHCLSVPVEKSNAVLLTFTEYNQNPAFDSLLYECLAKNYTRIYFWPQQYLDAKYATDICGDRIVMLPPSLDSLDNLLRFTDVDYVGTRLHAGIRALQHCRRSVIIAVDNRSLEMGRDFNLPILNRTEIASRLPSHLCSEWKTDIRLNETAIQTWKQQFRPDARGVQPNNIKRLTVTG